jgi:hypothetical protein
MQVMFRANMKERDSLGDLGIDGRILLLLLLSMFRNVSVRLCNVFIWLRIG